jgi:xanthine dehydrogenase accessory factor
MRMLARALERLDQGAALALVTVVRVSGSAPRHEGAHMLAAADGTTEGTIGGGRIALEATRAAIEVARGAPARRVTHHLVRDLAMCCGGSVELYIEPLAPAREAIAAAVALRRARRPGVLITHLDHGGKQTLERAEPPAQAAREGDTLIEPILPAERVFVVGCGHVGRALGPMAATVGFEVVACDDGDTGALDRPLPWAAQVIRSFEIADIEREAGELGAGDYVVIVTRDHALDERLLERLLVRESLSYVGLIGSRRKIERFRRRLEAKKVATPARWARLRAPIGLDIGAETPEEIAVAVAAELVAVKRARRS